MHKNLDIILEKLQKLHPVAMRLELKKGNHQCNIINDSYSSDLDSLTIALDFLSQQSVYPKKTLILSDLLESGMQDEVLYSKIAAVLKTKSIDRLIAIGSKLKHYVSLFDFIDNKSFYDSTDHFLSDFRNISFREETVLLKGARMFEFEKISNLLEQKTHDTILEINLNAISYNLKIYRQLLKKDVGLMVMVKAFSYGSGSSEIAHLLQQEGVEYLAVAYADEGVELRKSGIHLPIMVMNTSETGYENVVQYQLEPEIFSSNSYNSFKSFLKSKGIAQYPIHLKMDTGMHRLGFMDDELQAILDDLKSNTSFRVKSIFSHLAASENPDQDGFTQMQGQRFHEIALSIEKILGYTPFKHLANTSGIHRHPQFQFDMVRLGIGLYGVDSSLSLQNVTTLKTTIAQIKNIKIGESVGYGRKALMNKDAVIATVRIGYADGFPRSMGNGEGKMLVNGLLAPVVGNVCMDMTMIDISDISASEGDEVIIFGKDLPVSLVASWGKTIPYEILTNVSQRVKRVYFQE
jgi:alanine racemase